MEVYSLGTGKIKEINTKERTWYLHEFGIVDWNKTGFLEKIEEEINDMFHQEILFAVEKMSIAKFNGDRTDGYVKWYEQKEPPVDSYENDKYYLIVFKKKNYYCTKDGNPILDDMIINEKVIKIVNKILYRNGELNEKEFESMKFMFTKMGIKIRVKGDSAA